MKQWLRAAVLGSNDGLVSISCLMMGASAAKTSDITTVGMAGVIAGAMSMAVGEYVSVRSEGHVKESIEAAVSSALSFTAGGLLPLIGAYTHAKVYGIVGFTLAGLVIAGVSSARAANKPILKTTLRIIAGGIAGMVITSGIGYLI
jgi:VIT1/CCC1 family predicted Fe2+/Mn2+ transporter